MNLKNSFDGAFTLVEIMIVIAIIGLLGAIAIPNFIKSRNQSQLQACIQNLGKIEAAKQIWGVEHGKHESDTPSDADLFGPDLYIKEKPACPGGGTYELHTIGENVTCTISGHTIQ